MNQRAILIVEDEALTRTLLHDYFVREGFHADAAENGRQMLERLTQRAYDVVLLDILLPGPDGLSFAPQLRERFPATGIILVTSKNADVDRILGLEVGADDYVTKPFNLRELLARVRALLRRLDTAPLSGPELVACIRLNDWLFDPRAGGLRGPQGEQVLLPKGEFIILSELARQPGMVCTREQLLGVLARSQGQASSRSLDVQISRLRQRIGDLDRSVISTARGTGYTLRVKLPSPP